MAFVIYEICLYGMGSMHIRGITTSNKPWLLVYLYMLWMPDCFNFFSQKGLACKCMHDSVGLKVHNKVFEACK